MHELGWTRSCRASDHVLLTPDTHVVGPVPGLERGTAVVHIGPQLGARFTMWTVRLSPGGHLGAPPAGVSRFCLVLAGRLRLEGADASRPLAAGDYAWLPPGWAHALSALETSEVVLFEKPYVAEAAEAVPGLLSGSLEAVAPRPLQAGSPVQVRVLLPETPGLDLAVNVMEFPPGATLPFVEVHVMEHGLLMLSGQGIYRLGEHWHPVAAGDVIWMAPYCPQWFGALGDEPARYLLYKDWNRHPLAEDRR